MGVKSTEEENHLVNGYEHISKSSTVVNGSEHLSGLDEKILLLLKNEVGVKPEEEFDKTLQECISFLKVVDQKIPNLPVFLENFYSLLAVCQKHGFRTSLHNALSFCLAGSFRDTVIASLVILEVTKCKESNFESISARLWDSFLTDLLSRTNSVVPATCQLIIFLLESDLETEVTKSVTDTLKSVLESDSSAKLTLLTGLADVLFPDGKTSKIHVPELFWELIQFEISSSDPLTRKRCQYLAKRGYFKKGEAWTNILLTLEVLEEKQTHIIKPVLSRFEKIASEVETDLVEWVLAVFRRMLCHENQQVIKWSLQTIFQLSFEKYGRKGEEFLTNDLIPVLNDSSLFGKNRDVTSYDELSPLGENCVLFFASLHKVVRQDRLSVFYRSLLVATSKVQWNSVSLFHIARGLAKCQQVEAWDDNCLQIFRDFIQKTNNQEKLIKAAIHCELQECLMRLVSHQVDTTKLFSVLSVFSKTESFIRGSVLYHRLVAFLEPFVQSFPTEEFSKKFFSVRDCLIPARFLIISLDGRREEKLEFLSNRLERIMTCITGASLRPYADTEKVMSAINLSTAILLELNTDCSRNEALRTSDDAVKTFLQQYENDILSFVLRQLQALDRLSDYQTVDALLVAFQTFCASYEIADRRQEFYAAGFSAIQSDSPLLRYSGASVLLQAFDNSLEYKKVFDIIATRTYLSDKMQRGEGSTRDIQSTWSILISAYLKTLWTLVGRILENYDVDTSDLPDLALESLEVANWSSLSSIFAVVAKILPSLSEPNRFFRKFLTTAKAACFENRKSALFKTCIDVFTKAAFQQCVMCKEELQDVLLNLGEEIRKQGEDTNGLFNCVVESCCNVWASSKDTMMLFIPLVVSAITFGDVFRKDRKLLYDVSTYIQRLEDCPANLVVQSVHDDDRKVRAKMVSLLASLDPDSNEDRKIAGNIVSSLVRLDGEELESKNRYYTNSMTHRVRNRVWQAVLILLEFLDKTSQMALLTNVMNQLVTENPQPSIRLLQEWICVLIILKFPEFEDHLWKAERIAVSKRAGSIVSFIAIGLHLVRAISDGERVELVADSALQMLIPWTMAQHFTPRLYAKAAFEEVWSILKSLELVKLLDKYQTTYEIMSRVPEMGNSTRALQKLKNDFYLKTLHHSRDLTLETVYYEIPRLTHLQADEWIPPEMIVPSGRSHIPVRNESDHLRNSAPAEWVAKAAGMPVPGLEDTTGEADSVPVNMQKKIAPWKSMLPDLEAMSVLAKKKQRSDGLVVVASLIDKPTNLGGLCRTCEVLGATEYVLQSLKFVEDKQFSALSVSAERWIPLKEVKEHELSAYIQYMKLGGYTVVGAEQASNSVSLTNYEFPEKTLLLLGNEKEGLPVDLIQQLDVCVEVPQAGLIRSMNVHVTGALFIWEYAKQHILK